MISIIININEQSEIHFISRTRFHLDSKALVHTTSVKNRTCRTFLPEIRAGKFGRLERSESGRIRSVLLSRIFSAIVVRVSDELSPVEILLTILSNSRISARYKQSSVLAT